MSSEGRLYCKVFADTDVDEGELANLIACIVSGSVGKWDVSTGHSSIHIEDNESFDTRRRESQEGFPYSRYYLDIERVVGAERDECVSEIARSLEGLWSTGIGAVATCDFEEELPRRGGYRPEHPRV